MASRVDAIRMEAAFLWILSTPISINGVGTSSPTSTNGDHQGPTTPISFNGVKAPVLVNGVVAYLDQWRRVASLDQWRRRLS